MRRAVLLTAVFLILQGTLHADSELFVAPSAWVGDGFAAPHTLLARVELAAGWSRRWRREDGEIDHELKLALWAETTNLLDVHTGNSDGFYGVEGSYDFALGCSCLRLGPRVGLGFGGFRRHRVETGARLTYRSIWFGLDFVHTGIGVDDRVPGDVAPYSGLQFGFGANVETHPKQMLIGAGALVVVTLALLVVAGISAN